MPIFLISPGRVCIAMKAFSRVPSRIVQGKVLSCVKVCKDIDTLSLPYTQGTDLSEQFMGQIKPSLLLSHRPPWVTILCVGGHRTQQHVWINLLEPCTCAVVLGIRVVGYSELRVNTVRSCCTLFCMVGNFLWVAAQLGYTPAWSFGSCGHTQWC